MKLPNAVGRLRMFSGNHGPRLEILRATGSYYWVRYLDNCPSLGRQAGDRAKVHRTNVIVDGGAR